MEDKLKDALREDMRQRLKKRLVDLEQAPGGAKMRSIGWRRWSAVAAVALLVIGGAWFWMQSTSQDPARLAQAYFEPLPNVLAPEVRGATNQSILAASMQDYEAGAYSEAISKINSLPDSIQTETVQLYLGSAYLANKQGREAIKTLSPLTDQEAAQWYLCLAHLSEGELDRTKTIATQLVQETSGVYRQLAEDLLREMP